MAFKPIRGYSAPGQFPASEHALRHIHRNASANGLGSAFTKVAGRVLFDPDRLQQLLSERAQAEAGGASRR